MKKYSEWSPTRFDARGLLADKLERGDWFVVPDIARSKDSEVRERANFQAALNMLGNEQDDLVEVHRFGHWGCGWFEIILVHPSLEDKAQEIEDALENHPILDDEIYSEMESEENWLCWKQYVGRDFVKHLVYIFGLKSPMDDWLFDRSDELYEFHQHNSPHCDLNFNYLLGERPTRDDLAKFIRELRSREREKEKP